MSIGHMDRQCRRRTAICQRENGNPADPFAVAVVKNGVTVGHIPWKISSVCSLFLRPQKWKWCDDRRKEGIRGCKFL